VPGAFFVVPGFYGEWVPDFVVTLQVGDASQQFVVSAADEVEARALVARDHVRGDRRRYRSVSGGRVDVVWRYVTFPDYTIQPIPCS